MHWSLDQVRSLTAQEYAELITYLRERAETDDESIDADALVEAKRRADERAYGND